MNHRVLVAAATVVVVLGVSASSSGAQTNGTTTTTTVPANSQSGKAAVAGTRTKSTGITPTTIKVGGLGYSYLYAGADVGARARFQRANGAGGVNGRTIEYEGFADDGGDPALDTQAATKLAQDDGVFAVVPAVAPDLAGASVLVQQKVPYFGWALSSTFCGNQFGFGFTGCLVPPASTSNAWGTFVAQVLGAPAGKTAAIITEDSPSGQYALRTVTAGATSAQLKVVYGQSVVPVLAAADYDGIVKAVMTSNAGQPPDSIFVVGSVATVEGVQDAARAAGYAGLFTNPLEYDPELTALAAGAYVMIGTAATETAATNPAMQQLVTDVRAIAPDQPIDQSVIAGYFSADLFLAAVAKAGRNLTVDRLLKVANKNFTYSVPNTVGPTKFPAAHTRPTPCGSLVLSDGAAYTVKVPYSCGKVVVVK
jgi:ABC-type branched-subunit amino acid transport system substrate-binding protein